ncbi:MAG: winged helix-turn-helix domain-containing protein [Blastocatellia bacterium]
MSKLVNNLVEFDQFRLDTTRGWLKCGNEIIPLPPKVGSLLKLLLQHAGQVVSKEQIFASIWPDVVVEESNLSQYVHLLRKTFTQHGSSKNLIETIPRVGYRFNSSVRNVVEEISGELLEPPGLIAQAVVAEEVIANSPTLSVTTASVPTVGASKPGHYRWLKPVVAMVVLLVVTILTVEGIAVLRSRNSLPVASIAVLPFSNLGTEPLDPSLRLGLADALITRLSNFNQLRVRPTAAVRSFTEKEFDPLKAGQDLGVEGIVTGSIQRENGRLRVTLQLVRLADQQTIWAGAFDESFSQLFYLQDHIAEQTALALNLSPTAATAKPARQSPNLEAYQLYLRGRYFWNRRTPEWIQKGIECFQEAIRLDPQYALAYAGLADSYALTSSGLPPPERKAKSRPAAEQALKLDSELAEAHASLGFIKYKYDWDWAGAEQSLRHAIALNPNYPTAHHWLGECLSLQGKVEEGLAALRHAEQLDPLSLPIKEDIGLHLYRSRQYDRAIKQLLDIRSLDPNYTRIRPWLARLYEQKGRYEEAVNEHLNGPLQIRQLNNEIRQELKDAVHQGGWRTYLQKYLTLYKVGKIAGNDARFLAYVHLQLGDKEPALVYLEKSFDIFGDAPLQIKTEPIYDPLRSEPRFQELLRRAHHSL